MVDLLKRIAFWYYENNLIQVSESEIIIVLIESIKDLGIANSEVKSKAYKILEILKDRIGILVEVGYKEYIFTHSVFQDYLAALEIVGKYSEDEIIDMIFKDNLHSSKNIEIIPLIASLLSQQNRKKGSKFLVNILNYDHKFKKYLPINLEVVLNCLLYGTKVDGISKEKF